MEAFVYKGTKTNQISFPLGGIGSGCIGLAGNGRLIDWEIFNRPNKGSVNGFSHFAIRAERGSGDAAKVVDARVLNGPLAPPYQGEMQATRFSTFGWGPRREYLTGLPHFEELTFTGKFPLAELVFADKEFPGKVSMLAFNPFIPLNDRESSIPAAFFEFAITNTSKEELTYTLAGVVCNPLPAHNRNDIIQEGWGTALHLSSDGVQPGTPAYGDLTLATDAGPSRDPAKGAELSWQQYWFRGVWFDSLEVYWKDFTTPGAFRNRTYPLEKAGSNNEGMLGVHVRLAPGQTRKIRFVITWSFPTCENYWKREQLVAEGIDPTWKNYYATQWANSLASAEYALANWDRLLVETRLFQETLFASTLPEVAIDAITGNMAILKSPTVLRMEDGTFYGWEGLHPNEGCCEGSCTHVWNYQQTLPFLFPALERSMRTADYKYNLRPDGGMPFRIQLPLGSGQWDFRACADGQLGGVLKTYRDWKICGDGAWLAELWPAVKQSLEFAWNPSNEDRWDPQMTGVLWGRQHHTLDMELFGPNAWLTGMYLGALKAAAEMADYVGDPGAAEHYRAMFARGKAWADANLFNGEYYVQRIDLNDKAIVEDFAKDESVLIGGSTMDAYWDEEHREIKYQIGEGSSVDQLLGQWHASLYGLGEIFDPQKVKQANAAIYKYNYIPLMGDVYNPCRIYCLNDEGGLVICAWPEGSQKPTIPAPYSQETMNGFEYSAATHMIMTGLIDEGMECITAIRKRYDGERRNPWNEFECGSNYARSMAAYALLNAFAGFSFDMAEGQIGFQPVRMEKGKFRAFWSLAPGWGDVNIERKKAELRVLKGELPVKSVELPIGKGKVKGVKVGAREVPFQQSGDTVGLGDGVTIGAGETLVVNW